MDLLLIQIPSSKMLHMSIAKDTPNTWPFCVTLMWQKIKIHTTKYNYSNQIEIIDSE